MQYFTHNPKSILDIGGYPMFTLIMRDHHTHPHKWDQRAKFRWGDLFRILVMAVALLLSLYWILFHR